MFDDLWLFTFFSVEKGTLVADYSTGVGSNTLVFTSQECYRLFEINGSRLFLKENLLAPSVCVSFIFLLFLFFIKCIKLQPLFLLREKSIHRQGKITYSFFKNSKQWIFG